MGVSANNIIEKQPSETLNLAFDFSTLLNTGDSISSVVGVSGVKIGGGESDLHIGTVSSSGTQVIFPCASGEAFYKYRIEAEINTTLGEILAGDGYLKVVRY